MGANCSTAALPSLILLNWVRPWPQSSLITKSWHLLSLFAPMFCRAETLRRVQEARDVCWQDPPIIQCAGEKSVFIVWSAKGIKCIGCSSHFSNCCSQAPAQLKPLYDTHSFCSQDSAKKHASFLNRKILKQDLGGIFCFFITPWIQLFPKVLV